MVFPNAACEDLSVGDSFPSKREIKDDNPCVESEVSMLKFIQKYLCFYFSVLLSVLIYRYTYYIRHLIEIFRKVMK